MKFRTKHRYVTWDENGACWSQSVPPESGVGMWSIVINHPGYDDSRDTAGRIHDHESTEHQYDGLLTGDEAMERFYDTESEDDMKFLQALMEL